MPPLLLPPPALSALSDELGSVSEQHIRRLRFPAPLEQRYAVDVLSGQKHEILRSGQIGLLIYCLFAWTDWLFLPRNHEIAWAIRALGIAPLMLCSFALIHHPALQRHTYRATAGLIVATAWSILLIQRLEITPLTVHYHTGIILVIMYVNLVLRLNFRYAAAASTLIFASYAVAIVTYPAMPLALQLNNIAVGLFASVVSLIASYLIAVEHRRHYLKSLQLKMEHAQLLAAQAELQALSLTDSLTGLANRRHFDSQLALQWQDAVRHQAALSVLFIDVDDFKAYNDHYGHQQGDLCLAQIAKALRLALNRPRDLAARYGGEEFVCLLPETDQVNALTVALRIQEAVAELNIPHEKSRVRPSISVSIGLASARPTQQRDANELLRQADEALYQAKGNGRNRIEMHQIG